eukprot:359540-Chlamydomonas_euryale.AAC.4
MRRAGGTRRRVGAQQATAQRAAVLGGWPRHVESGLARDNPAAWDGWRCAQAASQGEMGRGGRLVHIRFWGLAKGAA